MSTTTVEAAAREDAPANALEAKAPPKRKGGPILLGLVALGAVVGGVWYLTHHGLEDTDDAQIDADVTSVPARTGGVVVAVHFVENQQVKKGDLLVEIDPVPAQTRLAEAEANLKAAEAQAAAADADSRVTETNAVTNKRAAAAQVQGATSSATSSRGQIEEADAAVAAAQARLNQAESELTRGKQLFASGAIARQQMDVYETNATTARAQLSQAKSHADQARAGAGEAQSNIQFAGAKLAQASDVDVLIAQARARADAAHAQADTKRAARDTAALDLAYTKIIAPADGAVSKKAVEIGQMAVTGQSVVQLVPTAARWITANFKETQLGKMKVGQPVEVEIDAISGTKMKGEVESFSNATGARFALLPPDNASGNFTKIVQRVPVRVKLLDPGDASRLRPGLSAIVTVDTRK